MHRVFEKGHMNILDILVKRGVNLGIGNGYGETLLSKTESVGLVKYIVGDYISRCQIPHSKNTANNYTETPLHKAVMRNHTEWKINMDRPPAICLKREEMKSLLCR